MLGAFSIHNQFKTSLTAFKQLDPQLHTLSQLRYQYRPDWWTTLDLNTPGIYILTGGRQIGKSTSCKLLIEHCLEKNIFNKDNILYLPCDEIYDATQLSRIIRFFFDSITDGKFLLIIDEITFVKDWDRVIKALADEGYFERGACLITGSDTLILKEAAMRFPGRRGKAAQVDFHLYPLSFAEYVNLRTTAKNISPKELEQFFNDYLICGGYLRAINDLAEYNKINESTFLTYEQWIRGDFLKQGKNEKTLALLLQNLLTIGVSQFSYSALTQKIGEISKETCMDYCRLLERMDILVDLQAFDQNKKQGFPKKARKFHFTDPFIYNTIRHWIKREGINSINYSESNLVEATVANHCHRYGKTYYFKGDPGEIDVIWLMHNRIQAIEVKWTNQLRPQDLKALKQFKNSVILSKILHTGNIENIKTISVFQFLYDLGIKGTDPGV